VQALYRVAKRVSFWSHPERTKSRRILKPLFPPDPRKSFHTFFLVSWDVYRLKAQVLPIAAATERCDGTSQDPDCAPVGKAVGAVFGGGTRLLRLRKMSHSNGTLRCFSQKAPPPNPFFKNFHTFFPVSWNAHPLNAQRDWLAMRVLRCRGDRWSPF